MAEKKSLNGKVQPGDIVVFRLDHASLRPLLVVAVDDQGEVVKLTGRVFFDWPSDRHSWWVQNHLKGFGEDSALVRGVLYGSERGEWSHKEARL